MTDLLHLAAPRARHAADLALVRAVAARRPGAWERLLARVGDSLYGLVVAAVGEESGSQSEYLVLLERLRADDHRLLRDYDGRARLESYLRLCAVDLLAVRFLGRFDTDPSGAWRSFERLFRPELERVIGQCFPESAPEADLPGREDVYQDLSVRFFADGYRRLRSYDGRGRFSAYVRRVARNLCTDLRRQVAGRLRLPEAVKRRPVLEQEAYKLVHWRGLGGEEAVGVLAGSEPASLERVREAVLAVAGLPGPVRPARTSLLDEPPDPGPSPEDRLLAAESETGRERHLRRLEAAVAALPPEERLYVRLRFFETPPATPREIARRMGRAPREVYKLRDRVMAALKSAVRAAEGESASVRPTGGEG